MGGPDLPGIGYAFGLDRIIHILDLQDGWDSIKEGIDAFIIGLDDESKLVALEVANQCRQEGLTIELDYCSTVLKTQFKTSDRLNPQYIIIIGEEERRDGMVTIKNNQTKTQERIAIARCGSWMKENR
ncbi:MAG: His/Gly/Thr/Pro-type tRNA ligase C-terminal domain-containing protein [Bacilli bacterium]